MGADEKERIERAKTNSGHYRDRVIVQLYHLVTYDNELETR